MSPHASLPRAMTSQRKNLLVCAEQFAVPVLRFIRVCTDAAYRENKEAKSELRHANIKLLFVSVGVP